MTYPKLASYSSMRSDGWPFLVDGALDSDAVRLQARWHCVILDAYPPRAADILEALRAVNPTIKLYGYVVMKWWHAGPPGTLAYDMWQAVLNTNGKLTKTDGSNVDGNAHGGWINFSKLDTALAVADVIVEHVIRPGLWDRLFLDVSCARAYNANESEWNTGGLNDHDFDAAWQAGHRAFVGRLRVAVGSGAQVPDGKGGWITQPDYFPIIGNCGPSGEYDLFNGWMHTEHFPKGGNVRTGSATTDWDATMLVDDFGVTGYLQESYLKPMLSWIVSDPGYDQDRSKQIMRFGLGSACLRDGLWSFGRLEGNSAWVNDKLSWWYPEYDLDLGEPTSAAYKMLGFGAHHSPRKFLWRRDLTKGCVLVNPSGEAVSVYDLPPMHPVGQAVKTAWSVPPGDAVILVK